MNPIFIISILVFVAGVSFFIWDKLRNKKNWEKVIVAYSEVVGHKIVEHDQQYIGMMNSLEDILKIPKLGIMLPIPQRFCFVGTKMGQKKIYLLKLENLRWGFRIPSMNNEVYLQDRDENGNLIKINGKPKLRKYKFKYCDDVVEPDVKHWEENIVDKVRTKHRTKSDMLSKWIAPIMVGIILVAGIITIQMTTKFVSDQLKEQRTMSVETAAKVEENAGMMQNLIKRVEKQTDSGG